MPAALTAPSLDGAADRQVWRTRIYDPTRDEDEQELRELLASGRVWRVHDTCADQLRDLVRTRNPRKERLTDEACEPLVAELLDGRPIAQHGRWIWYPWSGRLVHLLAPAEFRELRADRNRYKITPEEQERLRAATVGVVGLSVGNAVALTLALEGVGGHLKLADFDHLELSNMNRIRASVHELGLPKTVLAARQILELDPYLELELFHDGATADNLDGFLRGLDLLVDECDSIATKFRLRELARDRGIPVLMETSDRGMLDVERYDAEPGRPLFHGLVGDVDAEDLVDIDSERKATLILKIIGASTTSARAAASMMEIDRSITAWPQLGSDVTLGGATVTVAARRLLLGKHLPSGRHYLDLERTLAEGAPGRPLEEAVVPTSAPVAQSAASAPGQVPEHVRFVVEHAILAPSGGNCQPWRFYWTDRIWLVHDRERAKNLLDQRHHASRVALGAALENLVVAAASRGLGVEVTGPPHGSPEEVVACVGLTSSPEAGAADLFPAIGARATNRRLGRRQRLGEEPVRRLEAAALARDARLEVRDDPEVLAEVGQILGAGERIRVLCPALHREMMAELRWTPEDALRTRDGIDLATLELTAFQRAAMSVLARPDVASKARRFGLGRPLEELSRDAIDGASAVALVSIETGDDAAWLRGGRAVQRVWLTGTALGLALQPMTAILYQFELCDNAPDTFSEAERREIASLRGRLAGIFPGSAGRTPVFLFRIAHAPGPTARALRRPVEQVLALGAPVSAAAPGSAS